MSYDPPYWLPACLLDVVQLQELLDLFAVRAEVLGQIPIAVTTTHPAAPAAPGLTSTSGADASTDTVSSIS